MCMYTMTYCVFPDVCVQLKVRFVAFCRKHFKAQREIRFLTVLVTFYSGLSDHLTSKLS